MITKSANGNEAVKVSLGHAGSPSNRISYYDGNGINGFTRKIINLFEADTWYHFRIQFDCDNNNFDVYINGKLEITGGNFINNKTTLNAFYLGQQYGDPTHTEYTDNMVWLGSNTHVNLTGAVAGDRFGYSVATAGDLNNDGFENIIVGAPYNDTAKGQTSDAGAVYIFNGSSGLTDTSAGSADNISYGKTANDHFGWSVSKAGNIDGNSVLEVMVGAPHFNDGVKTDAGKVYILTTGTVISEFVDLALPLSLLLIIITFNKYKFKKRKKKVR